jgi:hypothetical protein
MLAFPNVFHFFAHKFACLSGRRFAFPLIFARVFNCFFFWHNKMVSPLTTCLDVINNGKNSREESLASFHLCHCLPRRFAVAHVKIFGVTQMPGGKRSRAGIYASTLTTDEKRICAGRPAIESATSYLRCFV